MTTIRQDLWELITLQDSITRLNVTGQAGPVHDPTPEYARLQKRRDALQEQIAQRVEQLESEVGQAHAGGFDAGVASERERWARIHASDEAY